jgi:hypothetical protein
MLVFTPEPHEVSAKLEDDPKIEIVTEPSKLARVLDRIENDDLIIAPAHVV